MRELLIQHGDYVANGRGGVQCLNGNEALLQRVLFRLRARRGGFPLLPELGSDLHLLPREPPTAWQSLAARYVSQALQPENVTVKTVEVTMPEEGSLMLTVYLDREGETLSVQTQLG